MYRPMSVGIAALALVTAGPGGLLTMTEQTEAGGGSGAAQRAARTAPNTPAGRVIVYSFTPVRQYARPADAFTQGLVFHNGSLFEGTGLYGESRLRETVLRDGVQQILRSRPLPDGLELSAQQQRYQSGQLATHGYTRDQVQRFQSRAELFGEGIAIKGSRIYQLTWVEGLCLVWDISNWNVPARVFNYTGEGWGLTHDGTHLVMSNGSSTLAFRDPETFVIVRTVQVKDPRSGAPVEQLNELEFIGGKIFANIYMTRRIAVVDPKTGALSGMIHLDGAELGPGYPSLLRPAVWDQLDAAGDVLNGIAHDASRDVLFLTGKRWPAIFEVRLSEARDR